MIADTIASNACVLVVDDEQNIHDDFEDMLGPQPASTSDRLATSFMAEETANLRFDVDLLHAMSGEEACRMVAANARSARPISVAYIDIRMPPGIDGIETMRKIRALDCDVEIVIMTAFANNPLPRILYDRELLHKLLYIRKPFAREEIQQITIALDQKWSVERKLAEQRHAIVAGHRRLTSVLDATGDAIAVYDGRRLLFANRGYEGLMGATTTEMQALSWQELMQRWSERLRRPMPSDDATAESWAGSEDIVERIGDGDQERRLYYRSRNPVYGDRGQSIGDVWVYRDVSMEIAIEQMRTVVTRLRSEVQTGQAFANVVGTSSAMRQVHALMAQALDREITVLLTGESGTGKELVAKALHYGSARGEHPFVALNCAAIPATLIESELFGHEAGAFTGAVRPRPGCFERAQGGTLLLDEIGDMPVDMQAKLLRVLQEREVQRVGGTAPKSVDVRIIASTNRDLSGAIEDGSFRADLYYRIAMFPIEIPPLRERRDDIPLLAHHFLKQSSDRNGKPLTTISDEAMRALDEYEWPGNVRELASTMERAVLMEPTAVLQHRSLPTEIARQESAPAPSARRFLLSEAVQQAIGRAMEAANDNVSQAARLLGISRATLHRKLKGGDVARGG